VDRCGWWTGPLELRKTLRGRTWSPTSRAPLDRVQIRCEAAQSLSPHPPLGWGAGRSDQTRDLLFIPGMEAAGPRCRSQKERSDRGSIGGCASCPARDVECIVVAGKWGWPGMRRSRLAHFRARVFMARGGRGLEAQERRAALFRVRGASKFVPNRCCTRRLPEGRLARRRSLRRGSAPPNDRRGGPGAVLIAGQGADGPRAMPRPQCASAGSDRAAGIRSGARARGCWRWAVLPPSSKVPALKAMDALAGEGARPGACCLVAAVSAVPQGPDDPIPDGGGAGEIAGKHQQHERLGGVVSGPARNG